jgi:hypothetical protein
MFPDVWHCVASMQLNIRNVFLMFGTVYLTAMNWLVRIDNLSDYRRTFLIIQASEVVNCPQISVLLLPY